MAASSREERAARRRAADGLQPITPKAKRVRRQEDNSKLRIDAPGAGVVVFGSAFDTAQQEALLEDSMRTLLPERRGGDALKEGGGQHTAMRWSFNDDSHNGLRQPELELQPNVVPACLASAQTLLSTLGDTHRELLAKADACEPCCALHLTPLLDKLILKRVWSLVYSDQERIRWHHDVREREGLNGWVIIINLGADATLAWMDQGWEHEARLRSGDAILFHGHVLKHAIKEVHAGTCPAFFRRAMAEPSTHGDPNLVRVGLQMRAADGLKIGKPPSGVSRLDEWGKPPPLREGSSMTLAEAQRESQRRGRKESVVALCGHEDERA